MGAFRGGRRGLVRRGHPHGAFRRASGPGSAAGGIATPAPTFSLKFDGGGIHNLDPLLTINETAVEPMLRFKGGDATTSAWTKWGYGNDLEKVEVGADVVPGSATPLLGVHDSAVLFASADYMRATDAAHMDIATEDFVLELVFQFSGVANEGIAAKRTTANTGWMLYNNSTTAVQLALTETSGGSDAASITSPALVAGAWYHLIFFVDKSGSGICYANATAGSAASVSAVGTLSDTSSTKFTLGARRTDGTGPSTARVSYFAAWKLADWLDTHTQAAVARERFAKLTGTWPQVSRGANAPTANTRNGAAYTDIINTGTDVRTLHYVGANWPRVARRKTVSGSYVTGYLAETGRSNLYLQSQTFSVAPNAVIDAGDTFSLNAIAAPDGTTTADGVIGDATDGDHGVTQDIAVTATQYTLSVWAKVGNKNWLYLSDDTVANATAYFNLASPAVGTVGAGATAAVEDYGNGWVRCALTFTGTAATHTFKIQPADADGDKTVTGDGATVNTYLWGAQLVTGAVPNGYTPTTTGASSAVTDRLTYNATGNANRLRGSLGAKILLPNHDQGATTVVRPVAIYTSTTDLVELRSTNDLPVVQVTSGNVSQATVTGTTDVAAGNQATLVGRWKANSATLRVNGAAEGTPDTSVTVPASFTSIEAGASASNVGLEGIVSKIQIYNHPNKVSI